MLTKLAVRDLAIAAFAVGLWWLTAGLSSGDGVVGDFFGVVAGAGLGVCAAIFHEWGHLSGALASRSAIHIAGSLRSFFVFSFDSRRNSRRQFLSMSFGGFIATAVAVWVFYALLPDEQLASRVARGLALFLAFLGVSIEVPLVLWSLLRSDLPPVETFDAHREAPEAAS
jgi:hypothetical protein